MQNYVQVRMQVEDQALNDELIAHLSLTGFNGFEEEDNSLDAFIEEENFNEDDLQALLKGYALTYTKSVIAPQNWNEVWESSFAPVVVGNFCAVRAHFHEPLPEIKHEIIITPKMSFGTGHHATTFLMLQEMKHISFEGKKVADFGTGTGVLAILAEKLGSNYVFAIDNDDWSIENATENITANKCTKIALSKENELKPDKIFDIILANINRNIILDNLDGLIFGLKQGALLLLSGLLISDEAVILRECEKYNITHLKTVTRDNWIAILLANRR